jgi:hypothetical protein
LLGGLGLGFLGVYEGRDGLHRVRSLRSRHLWRRWLY